MTLKCKDNFQWIVSVISDISNGTNSGGSSKDGLIRNVMVKTEKSLFKRPVQKLCILPIDCDTKLCGLTIFNK